MITIKDVAKYAGVSHGTVSNVINGVESVSLQNVRKVEEAIKALGYKPNLSARNLKGNKIPQIAIVLPNITDSLYAALFTSINTILEKKGYQNQLFISNDIVDKENEILEGIHEAQIPGVIIVTCQPENKKKLSGLLEGKTKYVFLEREPDGLECNFVGFDNRKSVVNAMHFLKEKGFHSPGLIIGRKEYLSEKLAFEGYHVGITKYNYEFTPNHIRATSGTREDGFKAAIELLNDNEPVDSIICSNMQLLNGVVRAAYLTCSSKKTYIIALGDDSWNKDSREHTKIFPRPYLELAEKAVSMLFENMENPAFYEYQQTHFESDWVNVKKRPETTGEQKKIKVAMVDGEMANAIQNLLPDLKKKTKIEINLDSMPYDKLYEMICDDARRNEYDVFSIDSLWFRELYSTGVLTDLTPFINQEFLEDIKIKPEIISEYAKVNERYFVIPYHYSNQRLFYRKDLFESSINKRLFFEQYGTELRCPKSWMEFNAVARFFTREYNPESDTLYGTTLGGDYPFAAAYDFLPRLWAYGVNLFDNQGNVTIQSKNALKALENYMESYRYASKKSIHNWLYGQVDEFISGDAAMMILDSSYASKISNPHYSKVVGKVGVAQIPGDKPVHWIWSFGINEESKKKDIAIEFIRWICNADLAVPTTLLGNISASSVVCSNAEILLKYPWVIEALNSQSKNLLDFFPDNGLHTNTYHSIDILAKEIHDCVENNIPCASVMERVYNRIKEM